MNPLKPILRSIILVVSFSIVVFQNYGATYYVNDGSIAGDTWCTAVGDDSNDGLSISTPKLTLANMLSSIAHVGNDVIRIDNGTYTWVQVDMDASGTAGNVITIEGAGQTKTIITGSGGGYGFDLNGQDYVTVENLRWNNGLNTTIYMDTPSNDIVLSNCTFDCTAANEGYRAISFYNLSTDCTADNCIIMAERNPLLFYNCTNNTVSNSTISTVAGTLGVIRFEATSTGNTLNQNTITGVSTVQWMIRCESTSSNTTITNNDIDGNGCNEGLYMESTAEDFTIYNNYFYDMVTGIRSANPACTGTNCYFNSFYVVSNALLGYFGSWNIQNNSFHVTNNSNGDFCFHACCAASYPTTLNYNSYYHPTIAGAAKFDNDIELTLADIVSGTAYEDNGIEGDPDYFLAGTYYLDVDATSPLVGAGLAIGGITTDIKGLVRPAPPAIGATEVGVVLPIHLLSFSADRVGDIIEIEWATVTETNNDHFEIERSYDGITWQLIEIVPGSGNSNSLLNYSTIDYGLSTEVVYYRLFDIDYNGLRRQSQTIAVSWINDDCASISMRYKPELNGLEIRDLSLSRTNIEHPWDLIIFNEQAQVLLERSFVDLQYRHDIHLNIFESSGVYFAKMTNANTQCFEKIVVVK